MVVPGAMDSGINEGLLSELASGWKWIDLPRFVVIYITPVEHQRPQSGYDRDSIKLDLTHPKRA